MSGNAKKTPVVRREVLCLDCNKTLHLRGATEACLNLSMTYHRRQTGCKPISSSSASSSSLLCTSSSSSFPSSALEDFSNDAGYSHDDYEDNYDGDIYAGCDMENNDETKEAEMILDVLPPTQPIIENSRTMRSQRGEVRFFSFGSYGGGTNGHVNVIQQNITSPAAGAGRVVLNINSGIADNDEFTVEPCEPEKENKNKVKNIRSNV